MKYDVIIIGAGAAGLFLASKLKVNNGLIIDGNSSAGKKLLITGQGSCNITNACDIKEYPKNYGENGKKIRRALYKYNNVLLMKHMESLGVSLFEREDGKVFPKSLKASDVLDALLASAKNNGFKLRLNEKVIGIEEDNALITEKSKYESDTLVIATGGKSYPNTGSDGAMLDILENIGIEVTELRPALTPIYVENYSYMEASGVSFKDIEVKIGKHKTKGDVLLTHKGFSGPAILRISEFAKPGEKIALSFIDGFEYPKTEGVSKNILNFLSDYLNLPKSFIKGTLLKLGINDADKTSSIAQGKIKAVIDQLKNMEFSISGTGGFSLAMVTAGGIALDEINLSTFELKKMKNVYAIGEVTNINGDTGGFNLQYAYSSAMTAAFSIDKLWSV